MAAFSKNDIDSLDFELLREGSISVYSDIGSLHSEMCWLENRGYEKRKADFANSKSVREILLTVGNALGVPSQFKGNSINALNDHLFDLLSTQYEFLVLYDYDIAIELNYDISVEILNVLDRHSRYRSLFGIRFISLVVSERSELRFEELGRQRIKYAKDRGVLRI